MGILDGLNNGLVDPSNAGLLGMAQGLLASSGPSRMPVSLGQGLALGLQDARTAEQSALRNRLLSQQENAAENKARTLPLVLQMIRQGMGAGPANHPPAAPMPTSPAGNPTGTAATVPSGFSGYGVQTGMPTPAVNHPAAINPSELYGAAILSRAAGLPDYSAAINGFLANAPRFQSRLAQAKSKVGADLSGLRDAQTPEARQAWQVRLDKDSGALEHVEGGLMNLTTGRTWAVQKQSTPKAPPTHAQLLHSATAAYHNLFPYGPGPGDPTFEQFANKNYPGLNYQAPAGAQQDQSGVHFGGGFPWVHFGGEQPTAPAAPTKSGTGAYASPEDVRSAFQAGKISRAQATKILQTQFGYK